MSNYKKSEIVPNSLHYPLEKLRSRKHTFFNLFSVLKECDSKLKKGIVDKVNVFIVNLEKNVGKTYWMRERMNQLANECIDQLSEGKNPTSMFLWVFRNEKMKEGRMSEVNTDSMYQFYIRGTTIYTKGTPVGRDKKDNIIYKDRNIVVGVWIGFNTMHNNSSNVYNGYKEMFYDEYRSKKPLPLSHAQLEVSNFIVLLSNFQRDKKNALVYLFGNNEPGADLIAESLGIQKKYPYFIDLERGVFYLNSAGVFKGSITDNNIAKRFSVGNTKMQEFMNNNISMESDKGITDKEKFAKSVPWAYLMLMGNMFRVSIYQEKQWLVQNVQEIDWIRDPGLISFAYLTEDLIHSSRLIPITEDLLIVFADLYRNDLLLFWEGGAKNLFSVLWTKILKKNNLYE